jgi:5-methyltetrahydrofolate--homocysteine methyltransferase
MSAGLLERLARGDVLLADGAMGSLLMAQGLPAGDPPELWTLNRGDVLEEIAGLYLEAGAEIIQTNSFGASPLRLAEFGLENRCEEVNRRAAETVHRAIGAKVFISGTVGPCGQALKPLGNVAIASVSDGFRRQIAALAEGGADLISVETMSDPDEAVLAIEAAKSSAPGLPILATMTFERTPRGFFTVLGHGLAEVSKALSGAGADAIGSNCGNGAENMLALVKDFRRTTKLALVFQANAGFPKIEAGRAIYGETPDFWAKKAQAMIEAGAQIVGGCCGTTPEHIKTLRRRLDGS